MRQMLRHATADPHHIPVGHNVAQILRGLELEDLDVAHAVPLGVTLVVVAVESESSDDHRRFDEFPDAVVLASSDEANHHRIKDSASHHTAMTMKLVR